MFRTGTRTPTASKTDGEQVEEQDKVPNLGMFRKGHKNAKSFQKRKTQTQRNKGKLGIFLRVSRKPYVSKVQEVEEQSKVPNLGMFRTEKECPLFLEQKYSNCRNSSIYTSYVLNQWRYESQLLRAVDHREVKNFESGT